MQDFQKCWVIDTKTPSNNYKGIKEFKYVRIDNNQDYADMLKEEKDNRLSQRFIGETDLSREAKRKACFHHSQDMYHDPDCLVVTSIEEGLIPVPDEGLAVEILTSLQRGDKDIRISPLGRQLKK